MPTIGADGVEDDSTGATHAALRLREQLQRMWLVAAIELIVAAQAVDLAAGGPGASFLGAGTAAAFAVRARMGGHAVGGPAGRARRGAARRSGPHRRRAARASARRGDAGVTRHRADLPQRRRRRGAGALRRRDPGGGARGARRPGPGRDRDRAPNAPLPARGRTATSTCCGAPCRSSPASRWWATTCDNHRAGLPSELALLLLMDPATGVPRAVIDATAITEMRTGAVTAIGAEHLAAA